MKIAIFALAAVACALAAPPTPADKRVPALLRYDNNVQQDGAYAFSFEADNGIIREEKGTLKQVKDEEGKDQTVLVQTGVYSYPGEDGKPVEVRYFADETGYHAEGESIPKNQ